MAADNVTISLGLPGFRVTQQRIEPERYDIWVESTATGAVCPRCGQPSTAYLSRAVPRACDVAGAEQTSHNIMVVLWLNLQKMLTLSQRNHTPCSSNTNM